MNGCARYLMHYGMLKWRFRLFLWKHRVNMMLRNSITYLQNEKCNLLFFHILGKIHLNLAQQFLGDFSCLFPRKFTQIVVGKCSAQTIARLLQFFRWISKIISAPKSMTRNSEWWLISIFLKAQPRAQRPRKALFRENRIHSIPSKLEKRWRIYILLECMQSEVLYKRELTPGKKT